MNHLSINQSWMKNDPSLSEKKLQQISYRNNPNEMKFESWQHSKRATKENNLPLPISLILLLLIISAHNNLYATFTVLHFPFKEWLMISVSQRRFCFWETRLTSNYLTWRLVGAVYSIALLNFSRLLHGKWYYKRKEFARASLVNKTLSFSLV